MNRTLIAAAAVAGTALGLGALAGWTSVHTSAETVLALETAADQRVYGVDNVHSSVIFKIRHAGMANFYGRFNELKGEIHFDADDVANSRMSFTVPTASVDSGNTSRDNHLKNADFFNARQFAEITFVSTGIEETSDGVYEMTGDLTLQGETRPVTARLTDVTTGKVRENDAIGFEAVFSIKRSEFGMTKYLAPDGGEDGALGNTVELIVAVEAVAQ